MRVYIYRRERSAAKLTAERIAALGHSIAGCITPQEMCFEDMEQSGADVFIVDRYLPHPDGEMLRKALSDKKCILIDSDLNRAIRELEDFSRSQLSDESRQKIREHLAALGFKSHTRGAGQLIEVLSLIVRDERRLDDLKHCAYPAAAEKFGTSWQSVERNVRYAIESVWTHGDIGMIHHLFGYTVDLERGKPTNKAFLAQIEEHIRTMHA